MTEKIVLESKSVILPKHTIERATIAGILAIPRESRNKVFYTPQELAKQHGKIIPIDWEHNHDKTIGRARLEWDSEVEQLKYIGVIEDESIETQLRNGNEFHTSLEGGYHTEQSCPWDSQCKIPFGLDIERMALVLNAGMPETTVKVMESIKEYHPDKYKEADYPWDQCIADQKKAGHSDDSAKKICGSIKAKNEEYLNSKLLNQEGFGDVKCPTCGKSYNIFTLDDIKAHQHGKTWKTWKPDNEAYKIISELIFNERSSTKQSQLNQEQMPCNSMKEKEEQDHQCPEGEEWCDKEGKCVPKSKEQLTPDGNDKQCPEGMKFDSSQNKCVPTEEPEKQKEEEYTKEQLLQMFNELPEEEQNKWIRKIANDLK